MHPQPWVSGIKNCQEKSILKEKLDPIWIFFVWIVKSTQTIPNRMVLCSIDEPILLLIIMHRGAYTVASLIQLKKLDHRKKNLV